MQDIGPRKRPTDLSSNQKVQKLLRALRNWPGEGFMLDLSKFPSQVPEHPVKMLHTAQCLPCCYLAHPSCSLASVCWPLFTPWRGTQGNAHLYSVAVQAVDAIKQTAAAISEVADEQHQAATVAKQAAMVGVGTTAVLAAGVSSNVLTDAICSMLGYPFDLVVPGRFHTCSIMVLLCMPT
jgi:hypothetical protein